MEAPTVTRSRSREVAADAVEALKTQRNKLVEQGVSTVSIALGVTNVILTAFVIGRWPEHYWLGHAFKGVVYFPTAVAMKWKKGGGVLGDMLELCWVANALFVVFLVVVGIHTFVTAPFLSPAVLRSGFLIMGMYGAGPLGFSVAALGNALILHSLDNMSSLFIHLGPILTTWSLLGADPSTVSASYPELGAMLADLQAIPPSARELLRLAGGSYLLWWVLWVLLHVATLHPSLAYSRNWEAKVRTLLGRFAFATPRVRVLFYCVSHSVACAAAFGCALACLAFYAAYTLFGVAMLLIASWRGASRYHYYLLDVYPKRVRTAVGSNLQGGGVPAASTGDVENAAAQRRAPLLPA